MKFHSLKFRIFYLDNTQAENLQNGIRICLENNGQYTDVCSKGCARF